MKIGLMSGKTFECDNMSYTETDQYTGETTRVFTNGAEKKKYTVADAAIEFWEEDLAEDELEALMMWGESEEEEEDDTVSFG